MIKKVLKYFSVIFIFSLSLIILINNFKIKTGKELSNVENFLKHLIVEHKVNESHFDFHGIKIKQSNYTDNTSSPSLNNTFNEINFFISSSINTIGNDPYKKISYAENFLFTDGFKASLFRPPKHLA